MKGIETKVTAKMRDRLTPEVYFKVLDLAWKALLRDDVLGLNRGENLHIAVIVGSHEEMESLAVNWRKLPSKIDE